MTDLQNQFEDKARLARSPKWIKWLRRPGKHLLGMSYSQIVNKVVAGSLVRPAHMFTGDRVRLPLPSALDIYLTGIKVHDSEIRLARYLMSPPPA